MSRPYRSTTSQRPLASERGSRYGPVGYSAGSLGRDLVPDRGSRRRGALSGEMGHAVVG